jgi:uncharacterized protein (TIGR02231 family)
MRYDVTTTIEDVTVYPDRALIQRRGSAHLSKAGEHTLRVGGLPRFLQSDSLRATGSGPAGTRILGIEQELEYHATAPEEDLRRLREEIERLTREQSLLAARRTVLKEQRDWLRHLGEQAARSLAWGVARGTAKAEDVGALFTYTGDEAQRLDAAHLDASQHHDEITRELNARKREYDERSGTGAPDRLAALIRIEAPASGDFTLELSYLVGGASWRPRYDARVNAGARQVHLTQQALITQRTGEEWTDVSLALSTARPSVAIRLPDEPDPWYVTVRPPMPAPVARARMMRAAAPVPGGAESTGDALPMMAVPAAMSLAEAAPALPAELAGAEVVRSGTAQVFRLPGRNGIPSDGSPHTVSLGEGALPCQLEYVAAPIIAEGAHLRAQTTNTTGRVLLPGELHVFQLGATGEEYVGATQLELAPEGAELLLYLGVDSNIAVKRELIERDTDKGILLQSGIRKVTIGYRVTLANHTSAVQRVILKDVLPVPQHERVKVKTVDLRPQPSARTRLEQVTWELQLAAGEERQIEWRCVVESPSDLELSGLP